MVRRGDVGQKNEEDEGRIWGKKIKEIRRLKVMESFERDGSNFVCNSLGDRKPVQRTERRRNMMGAADGRDNDSCQCILNQLKTIERERGQRGCRKGSYSNRVWKRQENWPGQWQSFGRGRNESDELTNVVKRRADRGDVFFEREIVVEDNSKVATRRNVGERSILERDDR